MAVNDEVVDAAQATLDPQRWCDTCGGRGSFEDLGNQRTCARCNGTGAGTVRA